MEFRLLAGEWNHPRYPGPLAGVSVSQGQVNFAIARMMGGPPPALLFVASLLLSVVIFLVFWVLFKALVLIALFIPPLAMTLLRPIVGGPQLVSETVSVPLEHLRNIGGGGDVVAFAIDLPNTTPEVAVLLRMIDALEAERLRIGLQSK